MRILLINPPYRERTYVSPPLGLAYIASVLRKSNEVRIIDAPPLGYTYHDIESEVAGFHPDVVGVTAMTATIRDALETARIAKAASKATVMLGGVHPTIMPHETLENTAVDIVVRGEGEKTITELIPALERGKISRVRGISFRKGKKIYHNKPMPLIDDLDSIPFPSRDLLPMGKYRQHLGHPTSFATMMSSRGCPYSCIFCTKALYGSVYRMRSPENIISEMVEVREKFNTKEIVFYDDNFSARRERVVRLCDEIIRKDIKIKWKCEARVNLVDRQLLEKMKETGCYLIAYGVETGNQNLLDAMKKGITLSQIRSAFKETHKAGIETLAYVMIGMPGETRETIQKTLDFILEIEPGYVQMGLATPYPMTELYDIAKKKGLIEGVDWSEFSYTGDSATPVMRTEALSREELAGELKRMIKAFYMRPRYILKRLMRTRSLADMKRNASGLGLVRDWVRHSGA